MATYSQCSVAANDHVTPNKEAVREQILDFIRARGDRGVTADEIVVEWGCSANHVAPRLTELLGAGRLVRSGRRRKTRSGCMASVLTLPRQPQTFTQVQQTPHVPPSARPGSLFGNLAKESYPD